MCPDIDVDPVCDGNTLPAQMGKRVTKKSKIEFAEALKAWRTREGLSQSRAALLLGLSSKRTLQNWEIARTKPQGILESLIRRHIAPPPKRRRRR